MEWDFDGCRSFFFDSFSARALTPAWLYLVSLVAAAPRIGDRARDREAGTRLYFRKHLGVLFMVFLVGGFGGTASLVSMPFNDGGNALGLLVVLFGVFVFSFGRFASRRNGMLRKFQFASLYSLKDAGGVYAFICET